MKRIKIGALAFFVIALLICMAACGENPESSQDSSAEAIKIEQGYDKLQSLFLQIDDTYTEERIEKIAEDNNLYIEIDSEVVFDRIWLSETEPTMGEGAETWYKFDSDSIRLFLSKNDEDEEDYNYYVFNKTYQVLGSYMSVDYTFYDKELYTENRLSGYPSKGAKKYEKITKWDSIKDALDYALEYKINN